MTSVSRRTIVRATLACAGAALTGCTSRPAAQSSKKLGSSLQKVSYVTGYGDFGREAFAWYGLDKGFFREEGIELTIVLGVGGQMTQISNGTAQFAVSDYPGAVSFMAAGEDDFRCIAAENQNTMIALMALGDSGISEPRDLAGKHLAASPNTDPLTMFPMYAAAAGIDANSVKWAKGQPQELPGMLVSGQVAAIGQFAPGAPLLHAAAASAGHPNAQIVQLPYSHYLGDLYGNVLVASTKVIKEDPDLVRRFSRAWLRSLRESLADPEGTGIILHRYNPQRDPKESASELQIMKQYNVGIPDEHIGAMDVIRVARANADLEAIGFARALVYPEQFLAVEFLPAGSKV